MNTSNPLFQQAVAIIDTSRALGNTSAAVEYAASIANMLAQAYTKGYSDGDTHQSHNAQNALL